MKFKRIILITFILFVILTMGAVNASDNITSDNLTVNDDLNIESPVKEVEISENNSLLGTVQNDDEIDATNQDKLSPTGGTSSDFVDETEGVGEEPISTKDYAFEGTASKCSSPEILGAYQNLNGGTMDQVMNAILTVSNSGGGVVYLNGGTYTGNAIYQGTTINNVTIVGGSSLEDTVYANFVDSVYPYSMRFEGTIINNCNFSHIITDNRLVTCTVKSYGAGNYVGSMTDVVFDHCQSYEQFIAFTGIGNSYPIGQAYNATNVRFLYCNQTYDGFEDGHGQFVAALGATMVGCEFINTTSGQHSGAICISDESQWGPGYIPSSVINCTFINVTSKWFAVYIHGEFSTSVWDVTSPEIVENCTFINCTATEEYGGALGISHDDVQVRNCTFINVTGGQGSAIMIGGIQNDEGTLGGIAFQGDNTKADNIRIIDTTFENCVAIAHECQWIVNEITGEHSQSTGYGGAIYWCGDNGTVSNCSFVNCSSDADDVAIYIDEGNVTISNSKFKGSASDLNDVIYGGSTVNCILNEEETVDDSLDFVDSMYLSESGVVSGDAKVISVNPWSTSGSLQYTIPNDATNIKSAIVVVTSYSGSGNSDTYALHSDVALTTDSTVVLGSEDLTYAGNQANDPIVYVINNHVTKQYSDYQCVYNITGAISALSPGSSLTIDVSNSKYGSYLFDGRIKMIALFFAYDDGDNDNITYWLEVGQSWTNSEKSETIDTNSYAGPTDDFTLETISVSTSYAQTYELNGQTLASPTEISKGDYYIDAYWDSENHSLSDYFTQGSDLEFSFAVDFGSYKTAVLLLTEREVHGVGVVTQDNFYSFFNDEGSLLATVPFDELIFNGTFSGLTDMIVFNRAVNATGENAVLDNIAIRIVADDVGLSGFTLNANKSFVNNNGALIYATGANIKIKDVAANYVTTAECDAYGIFVENANNFQFLNSNINFTGSSLEEYYEYTMRIAESNGVLIQGNTLIANLPILDVDYGKGDSALATELVLNTGIREVDGLDIIDNTFIANVVDRNGAYPTLDCVMLEYCNNVNVINNTLNETDFITLEGEINYLNVLDMYYSNNVSVKGNNISVETTGGTDNAGTSYPIQLTGPYEGVVIDGNNLYANCGGPALGVYSQNFYGDTEITVQNNNIDITGLPTDHSWGLVSGIELQDNVAHVYNNTITTKSVTGSYVNGMNLYGISYAQDGETCSFEIVNNTVYTEGKYAVYLRNTTNSNVTGNNLYAHDLKGGYAVCIVTGDNNIIENNLPSTKANITICVADVWMGNNGAVSVNVPNATGNVTIEVNGNSYVGVLIDGVTTVEIPSDNLVAGENIVVATYNGPDFDSNNVTEVLNVMGIVTQDNYMQYFNQADSGKLFDYVPEGATLDFQGSIINPDQEIIVQMSVSKPVNIITSTNNAYVDLNTTSSSLLGERPANSFAITNGGSGTNITGIRFHNTQLWISNTTNVILDNVSIVVEDQRVGSGVGSISIRDNSSNVILKNSYIYINNNGGLVTFTMSWTTNCTVDNCTIKGEGNVGNLIFLNVYNIADAPSEVPLNKYNTVSNNKIYGKISAISIGIMVEGTNNLIINNTLYNTSISTSFGGRNPANNIYAGNTLTNGSSLTAQAKSIVYGNNVTGDLSTGVNSVAYGNIVGGKLTVGAGANAYNNTVGNGLATGGDNATIENNAITGAVTINKVGTAFVGNDVNGNVTVSASDNTIKENNISSADVGIVVNSNNVAILNNTVKSAGDYSIDVGDYNVIVQNNYLTCKNKAGNRAVLGSNNADILGNAPLNFIVPNEYTVENIQSVFDNANEGDTIIFSGYYLIKDAVFIINKPIIIEGDNATFDANYSSIMFYINASNVIFRNIIFANVNCSDNCTIYWVGDDGSILNCSFVNCAADSGGAIYWEGSNGNVSDCSFVNCSAVTGGAIYWTGDNGVVSKCSFVDCAAIADGGAIYWAGNNGKLENLSLAYSDASNAAINIAGNDVKVSNPIIRCRANDINSVIHGGIIDNYKFVDKITPIINISCNNIQNGENQIVNVTLPSDATGHLNLTLLKDDVPIHVYSFIVSGGFASQEFSSLNMGLYKINVYYSGDSNYKEVSEIVGFTVGPVVVIAQGCTVGDDVSVFVDFGFNFTDWINVKVNNRIVDVLDIEEGVVNRSFSTAKLIAGNHIITFGYDGDNGTLNDLFGINNPSPLRYNLHLLPKEVTIEKTFKSNDDGIVVIPFPENATGTVEVFVDGVREMVVKVVDGIARIDLSSYKDGNYIIEFRYSGDEVYAGFSRDALVNIHVKVAKITASDLKMLYTSKTKYSVKVYGGDGKLAKGIKVTFLINNKAYATVTTGSDGVASIALNQAPGSYKITAKASRVSVTKKLTVNHLLTLKTVKVKKSAKKLVLTATLKKVNGKYLKKKTVTFKFNGKKYKAKTNKKGVAKYIIKSKVLKKLKVGKKVKYQATYLKDTVVKTVKVKK